MGIREAEAEVEEKQVKWSSARLGGLCEQLHAGQAGGAELAPASKRESNELVLIVQLRVVKQQSP